MKSFANLTLNEIKKLFSQTAFIVVAIIWAVIMILSPIFTASTSMLFNFAGNMYFDEGEYESAIEAEFYGTGKKVDETLGDYNKPNGWVSNTYYYYLDELETGISFFSLILDEGYSFEEVNEVFYYYTYYEDEGEAAPDKKTMQTEYQMLKDELAAFKNILNKGDIKLLVENRISEIEEEIAYEKLVTTENGATEYDVAIAEFSINVMDKACRAYEKIIAEGNTDKDWMLNTAEYIYELHYDSYGNVPPSEQEFNTEDFYTANTYEEYLISVEESRKLFEAELAVARYSIEHKIPLSCITNELYSKDIWQAGLESSASITSIIMLIAAAMSIANEYATGTVRMLLIRPKKRWKILLSKYAAILTVGLAMILSSYVIQLIISILFGGFDTLAPDIFVTPTGSVYHLNAFVSTLAIAMSGFLSAVFVATVAFFFSTVVGKTSLSIVLSYLVTIVSGIVVSSIDSLTFFGMPYKVVKIVDTILSFTFIPYANFGSYYTSANSMFDMFDIFSMSTSLPDNAVIVTAVLLVWTAAILWLTTICFKKKDIKS